MTGLSRGSGASTLAAALHAVDAGHRDQHADVLACGAHPEALRLARVVAFPPSGPRPVLAVVPVRGAEEPSLETLSHRFGAVVLLPHIPEWARASGPPADAALVLGRDVATLTPQLRVLADALRRIVAAVLGSGQLESAVPPMVIRPRPAVLWRGLQPVEREQPGRAG
ncbi:hypothetical protein [Pseudonocardia sp. TRM90224]|uniref:hypothetical protein n=1 Tax=Pseudonocardia sp. TRM90224 TaxID=2812678 RepID=UPI001E603B51|nr:hypothetical protein [Pseudonocardia sp. TRM90224]